MNTPTDAEHRVNYLTDTGGFKRWEAKRYVKKHRPGFGEAAYVLQMRLKELATAATSRPTADTEPVPLSERIRYAIEDFRLFVPSPVHVHSFTPRPLMALDQCVVCYGLRERKDDHLWV